MESDDFFGAYWDVLWGINAPQFTMPSIQLLECKSDVEAFGPSSELEETLKAELLDRINKVVAVRKRDWPNKYQETKALLTVASEGKLYKPSMAYAMGAGKAVQWDYGKLFKAAEESRFHYDIALFECSIFLKIFASDAERIPPPEVLIFASKVLNGELKRPKKKGPQKSQSLGRDHSVVEMVKLSVNNGLFAYRNEATPEALSACDLVAEICANSDCGVTTYEAVKKIYSNRNRSVDEFRENLYPCLASE